MTLSLPPFAVVEIHRTVFDGQSRLLDTLPTSTHSDDLGAPRFLRCTATDFDAHHQPRSSVLHACFLLPAACFDGHHRLRSSVRTVESRLRSSKLGVYRHRTPPSILDAHCKHTQDPATRLRSRISHAYSYLETLRFGDSTSTSLRRRNEQAPGTQTTVPIIEIRDARFETTDADGTAIARGG